MLFDFFIAYARSALDKPRVRLVSTPTGTRKSTLARAKAVKIVTHGNENVVILVPRHRLGDEQIKDLMREHPGYTMGVAVWRGMLADDPETPDPKHPGKFLEKMCRRPEEAEQLVDAMLSVERHLCKRGRGKKQVKCPLYDLCGWQRQKQVEARIWFAAHESSVHEMPKAFGKVGWVVFDETPLDAFMFGLDPNDPVELPLELLRKPPPLKNARLISARRELQRALDKLDLPEDEHRGAPVSRGVLRQFAEAWSGIKVFDKKGNRVFGAEGVGELRALELRGKIEPDIKPNMSKTQVLAAVKKAAGNANVEKFALLWRLIDEALNGEDEVSGRIQVHHGKEGRVIRMVGLRALTKGWDVPTLICDATGDPKLLRAIWWQLESRAPPQLLRPEGVEIYQVVDSSYSKEAIAVEDKDEKKLERKQKAARRVYAAVLFSALQYNGADVALVTYKSTRKWIEDNCFVPQWLTLAHYGDVAGSNSLRDVRALYEVGRLLPPPEAVTRQAEALFGRYIAEREYKNDAGRIYFDAGSYLVWLQRHRDPMAQRLLWQVREATSIQTEGRARAGQRTPETPLDIHRWHDVPLPELGLVIPRFRKDIEVGLDATMLASEGVWLENLQDAAKAYPDLLTAEGLKTDRRRRQPFWELVTGPVVRITYQRLGAGHKATRAVFLTGVEDPRGWLELKLGPLAAFELCAPSGGKKGEQGRGVGSSAIIDLL
jgi:hypothetical protein